MASPPVKDSQPRPNPSPPPPPPPSSDLHVIHIPSYSSWFRWDSIHECEVRFLPEFFHNPTPSKNPSSYKYLRNSIVSQSRLSPSAKISFTDVRRTLVTDVGSIRRVFEFLENWGLINYSPPPLPKPLKSDDKDPSRPSPDAPNSSPAFPPRKDSGKRLCSSCKSICTIACFACDKYDLTLCARCYVRGNYRVGVSSSDFRRVEISQDAKADWTDKETLHLMEAVMHYADDWKKVAQHVSGRTEKECVTYFLKLSFGEQYHINPEPRENQFHQLKDDAVSESSTKRMRLTPIADASNPIMAQAAFLSALAGVEVAEIAAIEAVASLSEADCKTSGGSLGPHAKHSIKHESDGDTTINDVEASYLDAKLQLAKEEVDVERAISEIIGAQMKGIQEKVARFEGLDSQIEKEWQQLEQMKNLLFFDQLTLLFQKNAAPRTGEGNDGNLRTY